MPHDHHHHHHSTESSNIATAFWLNFSFTIIEIVGGLLTNSVAILADAIHDLGDSLAIGFAWGASKMAQKGADDRYSYGYRRWSLLSALVNSSILVLGSIWVLSEAIPRLLEPQAPYAPGMIALALLGVVVNGAAVYKLRFGKTQNEQVLSWHLLEDVFGWVAVLLGSLLLLITDWVWIDPVLSIGFTLFILLNVWRNLRKTLALFLQVTPDPALYNELKTKLNKLPFVQEVHHLHLWSLDGEQHVLTVHLRLQLAASSHELTHFKLDISQLLQPYRLAHTTVEFESPEEICRDNTEQHHTADHDHDHDHDHDGKCQHALKADEKLKPLDISKPITFVKADKDIKP